MRSLWNMTGPQIPVDESRIDEDADIIVIGAGLTGLSTAVLLARAGRRVIVLEARSVGAVTTGNTTGKLSLLQGAVFSDIEDHAGRAILEAYVEANREGQAWLLRELVSRGVSAAEFRPAYTYATSPEGVAKIEREFEACRGVGVSAEKFSEAPLPFATTAALRLDNQAQLQPMEVLAMLSRELRDRGGRIVENCRVRGVDVSSTGVQMETSLGTAHAELCILATGMPILDRGLFFAKLEPSRSFVAAYDIGDAKLPSGMFLSIDSPSRSLRTARSDDGKTLLLVGGESHTTGRALDTAASLNELDTWTTESFGQANRTTWWAAQDYRSHSRLPYAGLLPGSRDRIYTATGYNKWGMTNAIAAALTISADILGGHLWWAETLRRHHTSLADFGSAVHTNASVMKHLVTDWIDTEIGSKIDPSELQEGEGAIVREGAAPVGVARVNGKVCRVSGVCTHMGGVLNWNVAERSWDCPLHGSRFSATGSVLEGPALKDLE